MNDLVPSPSRGWYVAAWSHELGEEPTAVRVLDEKICLYRTGGGAVVALADRCPHRLMPLSMGRVVGDEIECGYHGIRFNTDGQSAGAPFQRQLPTTCRVRPYATLERHGIIWIWPDTSIPPDTEPPSHEFLTADGWRSVYGSLRLKARSQLLNENLLDLSHVEFLHPATIGSDNLASIPTTIESSDTVVRVIRDMPRIAAPKLFTTVMGIAGEIHRQQNAEFHAPGFHITHVRVEAADRSGRVFRHKAVHCVTPVGKHETQYLWAIARDYALDDSEVDNVWSKGAQAVFSEDRAAVEAIEQQIGDGNILGIDLRIDRGPLRARAILRAMSED